ncbi:DUF4238 domain-containing protein [Mesorhizobium sp. M0862]|uniref:DUF4238 domain-containing protein n=1 Tax=Mesorhizobium sp. M0862 TaxID=2957015 RepID=UPI003337FF70
MTGGKDPKLHHFLPQMLLRRFTDVKGRLAFYTKVAPAAGVIAGKPKGLFAENYLYTVEQADGSCDVELEKSFAKLEGETHSVLAMIASAARQDETPGLSVEQKRLLDQFFYMQWKRVPDMHAKSRTLQNADANIEELIDQLLEKHPDRANELQALRSPKEKARLAQGARVRAIATDVGQIMAVLDQRGLAIARTFEGMFAIGSAPIVRKRGDLREPDSEAWLPIASDLAIGIGRGKGTEVLIDLSRDQVNRFNQITAMQSTSFAAASRSLIEQLVATLPTSEDAKG